VKKASPTGLLVVNKPLGPTSHDVVAMARRAYATREVGHAGTLDPLATGVLILLFGEATKLSNHLTAESKEYRARVVFGRSTTTLDLDGETSEERPLPAGGVPRSELERSLAIELSRSEQVPPLFSAIQVDGRRAHREARKGRALDLPPRPVRVEQLEVEAFDGFAATVRLRVSKGYYVRSFARDLGQNLDLPAHLGALERLASGPFRLHEACAWPPADERPPLLPLADVLRRALPWATLKPTSVLRARQGKRLTPEDFSDDASEIHGHAARRQQAVAWFSPEGEPVALGEQREAEFVVVRGFRDPAPGGY
jgi:tRNA pseudouridine55 synthase